MRRKVMLLSAGLFFIFSQFAFGLPQKKKGGEEASPSLGVQVKTSFVCMVDNRYKGKEQIPVEVDGKVYYGCCKGCVSAVKNDRSVRYSQDPLTNEEVDKAEAFIVLKPGGSRRVFYFKSQDNYLKWAQTSKKDSNRENIESGIR